MELIRPRSLFSKTIDDGTHFIGSKFGVAKGKSQYAFDLLITVRDAVFGQVVGVYERSEGRVGDWRIRGQNDFGPGLHVFFVNIFYHALEIPLIIATIRLRYGALIDPVIGRRGGGGMRS